MIEDKIIIGMAAIPDRAQNFAQSIPALLPQCDELHVYLNNFEEVPKILCQDKIIARLSQDHAGDLGDRGKFWPVFEDSSLSCYLFTVDDDILYPPDYVSVLKERIDAAERRSLWGVHGAVIRAYPNDYYKGRQQVYHYRAALNVPKRCNVLGTGTLAYHTDTLCIQRDWFPEPNMADTQLAVQTQKLRIPMRVCDREKNWLTNLECGVSSIWGAKMTAAKQADLVRNAAPWQVFI